MLGLTIPDAIAFGSLCAALVAAYAGMIKGERVKTAAAPSSTAPHDSTPIHREALDDLTRAVTDLTDAIRAATLAEAARDQYNTLIDDLVQRLSEQRHDNTR